MGKYVLLIGKPSIIVASPDCAMVPTWRGTGLLELGLFTVVFFCWNCDVLFDKSKIHKGCSWNSAELK